MKIRSVLKVLFVILLLVILAGVLFVNFAPVFGDRAQGSSLMKIDSSKNYNGKKFVNLVQTSISTHSNQRVSVLDFIFPPKDKNPQKTLLSKVFEKDNLKNEDFVWFGHSTILMKINFKTILTDPVFNRASPIPLFGKEFKVENKTQIEDLPQIDVIVISHDHYDHLDYIAIKELNLKTKKFLVPLGVKAHLLKWGVLSEKIEEFDWYENYSYENINFTLTPMRHFSGRGLTNRDSTLWGSWVIKSNKLNVFFSGDGGYFEEFKKIGKKFGPFDITFMENGAYNEAWSQIHMMPEQSVQAAIDLNSKVLFPIHWSKFDLSVHKWDEPIKRLIAESDKREVEWTTPLIGEKFTLKNLPKEKWWESLR